MLRILPCFVLLAATAHAAEPGILPKNQALIDQSAVGVYIQFAAAGSTPANPYGLSYGGDHRAIVKKRFKPAYDEGVRLFMVHLPFGATRHQAKSDAPPMELDAAVHLSEDPKWSHVIDEYHEAREWAAERMPDAVFLDYLGTVEEDLYALKKSGDQVGVAERLRRSVEPCMRHSNVWIGLDASSGGRYPAGSVWEHFAAALTESKRRQGCEVICEALPQHDGNAWSWGQMATVTQKDWTRFLVFSGYGEKFRGHGSHRARGAANSWKLRYGSPDLPTLRVIYGHAKAWVEKRGDAWLDDYLTSCLYFNHMPVVGHRKTFGYTPEQIRDRYQELRETHTKRLWAEQPELKMVKPVPQRRP